MTASSTPPSGPRKKFAREGDYTPAMASRGLIGELYRLGRPGGVVLCILGTAGLLFSVSMLSEPPREWESRSSRRRTSGEVLMLSVMLLGGGLFTLATGGATRHKPLDRETLLTRMETQQRPFTVCPYCQLIFNFPRDNCDRCGTTGVMVVDSDGAAAHARRTLGG